ncbi:MAG TPA: glycosyltransferase family 4 protein, partial [Fibrobacteria bacterium]|nr:glycosyltransferase family 4 protein [Fibrobacteria bacterium]
HFALYGRPLLGLLKRRPWVMHFHGPWAMESRGSGGWSLNYWIQLNLIERPTYRAATRVITLSAAFAAILREKYGVSPERIRIVQGGFDPTPFANAPSKSDSRAKFQIPENAKLVVCVRRLQQRMGLENLVDAASRLLEVHPELIVAIAGKGPSAQSLQERIDRLGLQGRVRLLGFVPDADLPALYAAADLSVVPTVSLEGFGLIVAESMAAGTPVVSSKVGALPELLAGFAEQLLADPTVSDLSRVLGGVLDGTIPLPSAEACRAHSRRWSWEEVTPRLEKVYREALEA